MNDVSSNVSRDLEETEKYFLNELLLPGDSEKKSSL